MEAAVRANREDLKTKLQKFGISSLRSLGRYVGVAQATTLKKEELTKQILEVVSGERRPTEKSKRGAPVKEDFVDPAVLSVVEEFYFRLAVIAAEQLEADGEEAGGGLFPLKEQAVGELKVASSKNGERAPYYEDTVYAGEIIVRGGVFCANISQPQEFLGRQAVISSKKATAAGVRAGDAVTFHAVKKAEFFIVTELLSRNALFSATASDNFDRTEAEFPKEKLLPFAADDLPILKYFSALYPVGMGQRVLLSGAPKSGKSTLLKAIAASLASRLKKVRIVIGLCERAPEEIGDWQRAFPTADIYFSSYCDEAEEHVSQAEKAAERAKAYVCEGKDTVLLTDDLNSLARAFNETERSVGGRTLDGGLESKTAHYVKKYLGAARKVKGGASLTIIGAISLDTGVPFDEALYREVSAASSAEWRLGGNFRKGKAAFPDCEASRADGAEKFLSDEERNVRDSLFDANADRAFAEDEAETFAECRSLQELLHRLA